MGGGQVGDGHDRGGDGTVGAVPVRLQRHPGSVALALVSMFLVAVTGSMLSPSVQTHMIDAAHRAPSIGATIHHSAFNAANALGAVMGAQVLMWGFGLRAPSFIGAIGAAIGLMIALYAWKLSRERQPARD